MGARSSFHQRVLIFSGVSRLIHQSPDRLHLQKRSRSQGPSLHRSYPASSVLRPRPTPVRSAALRDVEAATFDRTGLPRCPLHPSGVPCPLPRRIERVHVSIASPSVRPSPFCRRVGIRISTFEDCSGLHSRYGPSDCSTAQGGLCHEASIQPVARPNRSSATRVIDNSLGGTYLHW